MVINQSVKLKKNNIKKVNKERQKIKIGNQNDGNEFINYDMPLKKSTMSQDIIAKKFILKAN